MSSSLQRFILRELYLSKKARPAAFRKYYTKQSTKTKDVDQQSSIIRSLERMIDTGLLVGHGRRTKEKWFIQEVTLTPKGKKKARTLFVPQPLPLFTRKSKKNGNSKKS